MGSKESIELKEVELALPLIGLSGKWVADRAQMNAAWSLYVELVTRIATQPLDADHALVREAMDSLRTVIFKTRTILRDAGPAVARPARPGALTFAAIAVDVVNRVLRPFLTKWHPALLAHEKTLPAGRGPLEHEKVWADRVAALNELEIVRKKLVAYASLLADAANVPEEGLPSDLRKR